MPILTTFLVVLFSILSLVMVTRARFGSKGASKIALISATLVIAVSMAKCLAPRDRGGMQDAFNFHATDQKIQGRFIGRKLAADYPGSRVAILTPPEFDLSADSPPHGQGLLIETLRETLETAGLSVTVQSMQIPDDVKAQYRGKDTQEMAEELMALEMIFWLDASDQITEIRRLGKQADVIVSTVEFTSDSDIRSLPGRGEKFDLVLLNAIISQTHSALTHTALAAILLPRTTAETWEPDAKIPKDLDAAFNHKHIWVNRENAEDLEKQGLLP